jgi:hypothetical protein
MLASAVSVSIKMLYCDDVNLVVHGVEINVLYRCVSGAKEVNVSTQRNVQTYPQY